MKWFIWAHFNERIICCRCDHLRRASRNGAYTLASVLLCCSQMQNMKQLHCHVLLDWARILLYKDGSHTKDTNSHALTAKVALHRTCLSLVRMSGTHCLHVSMKCPTKWMSMKCPSHEMSSFSGYFKGKAMQALEPAKYATPLRNIWPIPKHTELLLLQCIQTVACIYREEAQNHFVYYQLHPMCAAKVTVPGTLSKCVSAASSGPNATQNAWWNLDLN